MVLEKLGKTEHGWGNGRVESMSEEGTCGKCPQPCQWLWISPPSQYCLKHKEINDSIRHHMQSILQRSWDIVLNKWLSDNLLSILLLMKIRVFSNTLTKLTVTKSLNKVTTQKASYVFTPLIYIQSHEVDAMGSFLLCQKRKARWI